ncbi:MAG: Hsp20/alpha crystallin family protein [Chloroflexi bacterium]|nr:Hsp20/alpha crystallin family protein [Chloroflexota bacterium]
MATRTQSNVLARRSNEGFIPLREMMDRIFEDAFFSPSWFDTRRSVTGSNLYETPQEFILQVALPGAKPESIEVNVQQNTLTIKGEPALTVPDGATAIWRTFGDEIHYGVELPAEVDGASAKATYQAGVLTVELPKAPHVLQQTIKVTAK